MLNETCVRAWELTAAELGGVVGGTLRPPSEMVTVSKDAFKAAPEPVVPPSLNPPLPAPAAK